MTGGIINKLKIVFIFVIFFLFSLSVVYSQDEDIEIVIKNLKSENSDIRRRAAETLGNSKDPRAVEPLIVVLEDRERDVRLKAIDALKNISRDRATEALIFIMKNKDEDARINAIDLFWELNKDRSIYFFRQEHLGVKGMVKGKWEITGQPPVNQLIAVLRDPNLSLRNFKNAKIIKMLYPIFIDRGEPGTEEILIDLLNNSGSQEMVYDFVNSGNAKLEEAAVEWAKRNGYEIVKVRGNFDLHRWGNLR